MSEQRPAALVTGGRRGIGRGIAWALAERGFDIVVLDVCEDDDAQETLRGIGERGGRGRHLTGDISQLDVRFDLARAAMAAFGRLDCLVNNAGVQVEARGIDLLDSAPESFDRVMGVNLRGTFFLTQAVARLMVEAQPDPSPRPRSIVSISSVNAFVPVGDRAEYCFSKLGVSMMTKLFAQRLAPHGINTYEIRPGMIRTEMTAAVRAQYDGLLEQGLTPIRRWGEPADIGCAVATLATGGIPFSTGDVFHVDGGLHIPSPGAAIPKPATRQTAS